MDAQAAHPQRPARERILDAALAVFSERGFEGGTIRQIASKAGVAEGLIYHYFDNKEALLGELMRRESLLSWIEEQQGHLATVPLREGLPLILTNLINRLSEKSQLFVLVWAQIATSSEVAKKMAGFMEEGAILLAAYLRDKQESGELRALDPLVTARSLLGAILTHTMWTLRMTPPLPEVTTERLVGSLVDLVAGEEREL
jgi:AcrR family transcriptional regulator